MSRPTADAERRIAICFLVTTAAALALAGVYVAGGQPQAEGALLAVSLGSLGVGFLLWARHLLPNEEVTGPRDPLTSTPAEREGVQEAFDRGEEGIERRGFLLKLLGLAGASLALAAVFPIRSLGPNPGNTLKVTAWRRGSRVVGEDGRVVRVGDLPVGSILTVFPEGHVGRSDSQAVLINVGDPSVMRKGGQWAPSGLVAFSKICTHAGCPVGLYRTSSRQLLCPCHQSTFDVVEACEPVFGPATRPLPQLPLRADGTGELVAEGDFEAPVGPSFWDLDVD